MNEKMKKALINSARTGYEACKRGDEWEDVEDILEELYDMKINGDS